MLSERDYAGSGMRMRDAFRRHYPEHEIHLVTYGYPVYNADYVFAETVRKVEIENDVAMSIQDRIKKVKTLRQLQKRAFANVQKMVDEADIIHFKGDEPPTRDWHGILEIPENKKIVVTVGGSQFRREAFCKDAALASYQMGEYMLADLRTALTPDLNYPEYEGIYTQHAIDCENVQATFNYGYTREGIRKLTVAHSPSNLRKKGTDSIFLPAAAELRAQGRIFDVKIIHKVPFQKCVEMKKSAQIFFDQAGVGFYGNAALEAMQFGIPTICHISQEAIKQSNGKITRDHPIIAFRKPTVNACIYAIRRAIDGNLKQISRDTKEFCDSFHSYSTVAKMWKGLYEKLL